MRGQHTRVAPRRRVVDPGEHRAARVLGGEGPRAWSDETRSSSPCASCMRACPCRRRLTAVDGDGGLVQVEALVDGRVPEWATRRQPMSDAAWRVVTALAERSALPRRLRLCAQLSVSRLAHARQVCPSRLHVYARVRLCGSLLSLGLVSAAQPSPRTHTLQRSSSLRLAICIRPRPWRMLARPHAPRVASERGPSTFHPP